MSRIWVLTLAIVCVAPAARAEQRFALLIGSNFGHGADQALRWAEQDVQRVSSVLEQLGDVPQSRQLVLAGASVDAVRLGFARMRGRVEEVERTGERTLLLVYYSGHADRESLRIRGERLPMASFREMIQAVPTATRIVILDACHSGAVVGRARGLTVAPEFDIAIAREASLNGTVYVTSAGPDEIAQESDELGSAYFTHHLVTALRGAADGNHDGKVTLDEAYLYAYNRTLATSHASVAAVQHALLDSELSGEGSIVLTRMRNAQATVTLADDMQGDLIVINDENGEVVAEIRQSGERPVTLAVAAGRYRLQMRRGSRVLLGEVSMPWGGATSVSLDDLTALPLHAALARGPHIERRTWQLGAAGSWSLPPIAAGRPAANAEVWASAQLSSWVHARLQGGVGRYPFQNESWRFVSQELRFIGELGAALRAGPFVSHGWLGIGAVHVSQRGERRTAGTGQNSLSTWTGAGVTSLTVDVAMPVGASWYLGIFGAGRAYSLVTEGSRMVRASAGGGAFVAREMR